MVVVSDHRAGLQRDLDLRRGDQVLVLFREENSCFGRRSDGQEGYFPPACVEPLQWEELQVTHLGGFYWEELQVTTHGGSLVGGASGNTPGGLKWEELQVGGASCRATPPLLRRGSVPAVRTPPCGCSSGHGTPKQLKKILLKPEGGGPRGGAVLPQPPAQSPGQIPEDELPPPAPPAPAPPDHGSINTTFQAD
ncbi:SH3 domain containing protein Dlish [Dissostichus eleginoides]|uniref:SH3 domain containing protein Dlish n=1 Tax=Dissostichus eleginoides TaxID=100907 RepID=A0AAD9EN52_DISEL|nr:SH3 domain containing protein Dlish [Dissostichus eleginoides]